MDVFTLFLIETFYMKVMKNQNMHYTTIIVMYVNFT
jgi:hypothetical protein